MYDYGIIGNCQISALVHASGSIDWCCLPRPDSPPIFGKLLDPEGGHFQICPADQSRGWQQYQPNTNLLETLFTDAQGNSFIVTDFAPRFEQYGRMYRPSTLIRIVTPVRGHPHIKVSCRPVRGWSKEVIRPMRGNSSLRFEGLEDHLRLTTNMPLTYLVDEIDYPLTHTTYFALTWGSPVEEDLETVCQSFLRKTTLYWRTWVKHCSIPPAFQREVIRSALTLKLHCYEDTGAILAAITTSLPEEVGAVRNWDYRFCWLRDAYFSVTAFYKLGHFEEMEGLLEFLFRCLQGSDVKRLKPVYRLDGTLPLPEIAQDNWAGFKGTTPVRAGNQAAEHVQNDVYGEMLLTLSPLYFDDRFSHLRTREYDDMLHMLAAKCNESLHEPDAGLWEIRDGWKVHAFTLLLCWAGLDRYERLLAEGRLRGDLGQARAWKEAANTELQKAIKNNVLWNSSMDLTADASSLLLAVLGYPDAELGRATIAEVKASLAVYRKGASAGSSPSFFFRYKRQDDFGVPNHAFLICSFWMIQALAKVGEKDEAQRILEETLHAANGLGLFAEHFDCDTGLQTGNFPQCYSHVGLIQAAFSVSPSWDDVL